MERGKRLAKRLASRFLPSKTLEFVSSFERRTSSFAFNHEMGCRMVSDGVSFGGQLRNFALAVRGVVGIRESYGAQGQSRVSGSDLSCA